LIFNDTRSHAEARAEGLAERTSFDTPSDINFREKVSEAITTELTDTHKTLIQLLRTGIAYHHAGLEQDLKDLIEAYTEQGIIKCVFCTTTLSYGFDSPVQSVIVADLKRWSGQMQQFIGVYEYVQWIGRAGRYSSVYNQAYAFPMYNDTDAPEMFQFDTRVEHKDLEDVTTHLSGKTAFRWLLLELVTYEWDTEIEILDFVESTLYWSETVDQVSQHVQDDYGLRPGDEIRETVEGTLDWLARQGTIETPVVQPRPQIEGTRYRATELGVALVEYDHSNWFDTSVQSVLTLAEWLDEQGDDLRPESLIQRLATEYYHCDTGKWIEGDGKLSEKLDLYDLTGTEGATAALISWFWCAGVSVSGIESAVGADNLSSLVNTASNLSDAVDSVRLLYDPFEVPPAPDWLEVFAAQIENGVPGPDMYLVNNVEHFGRVTYNRLEGQLNRVGGGSDWDPGNDHFVIERLSKLLAERAPDLFRDTVESTPGIGTAISANLLAAVQEWDPENTDMVEVPFAESVRDHHDSDLTQYHDPSLGSSDGADTGTSTPDTRSTTLDDF
jgi:hypothetical protein